MTAPVITLPIRPRAARRARGPACPVVELEDHRAAAMQLALDEQSSGLAVRAVWAVRIASGVHPTVAHLLGVAEALEEVADAGSWEEALAMLDQVARGCRRVAMEVER